MNNTTFVRKIIYLCCAALLIFPLAMISLPASKARVDESGKTSQGNKGGKLAQLRDKYNLSQAKLMEIDPASETMKLASVGLRGVAVNMLWMQAMEHRKKQNWDKLRSTLNALIKIQPNFIKVWEYQAHNLSYNISVEFDDYEYRYHWVKEGIKFLTEGIPYNIRNHRITDNLGFFTGLKIGRSDEKEQFRRLFRKDKDFHQDLFLDGRGIEPDLYDTREYGHDNWKLAYHWYDKSRQTVNKFGEQYLSDMMFYRKRPMQLMNQVRGLQDEFETDQIMQKIWIDANREWKEFGQREIRSSNGTPITFNGLSEFESRLATLRKELDALVPGYREEYMNEIFSAAKISDEAIEAMDIPADERTEEQSLLAATAQKEIQEQSRGIDGQIANNAGPSELAEARRIAGRINKVMSQMQFTESYAETINYKYWDIRSELESKDIAAAARQAMYQAQEMKRNSIFDDEYVFDPEANEKKIVKKGAISLFEEAFDKWRTVLQDPLVRETDLIDGEVVDDLMEASGEYYDMLRVTGREWPADFVFQYLVDERASFSNDNLPTSQDIADRISGRSDGDPATRKRLEKARIRANRENIMAPDPSGMEVPKGMQKRSFKPDQSSDDD